jgi:hypothetical protein
MADEWSDNMLDTLKRSANGTNSSGDLQKKLKLVALRDRKKPPSRSAVLGMLRRINERYEKLNISLEDGKKIPLLRLTDKKTGHDGGDRTRPKPDKPRKRNDATSPMPKDPGQTLLQMFEKASAHLPDEKVREDKQCTWPVPGGGCLAQRFNYRVTYCCVHMMLSMAVNDRPLALKKNPELDTALTTRLTALNPA